MSYKLRKLLALYRDGGLKATARSVLSLLAACIHREEEHVVLVRSLSDAPEMAARDGIEVRSDVGIDREAVIRFSQANFPPKVTAYVRNYLDNGYRTYLGFRGDELIGLFWWVDRQIDAQHPDLVLHQLRLGDRDAYGFSYFLAPEHRGGGTASEFISKVFVELDKVGYERIWGWVLAENLPARWLFSLVGYEEVRSMRFRTFFSIVTVSDGRALIRNLGIRSRHRFGQRPLVSLPRTPAAP